MKLGVYNAVLHDRSLPEALDVIVARPRRPRSTPADSCRRCTSRSTTSDQPAARDDYLASSTTGHHPGRAELQRQPAAPRPGDRPKHAEDLRKVDQSCRPLGQTRVVTMSGLPGGEAARPCPTGSSTPGTPGPSTCSTTSGTRSPSVLEGDRRPGRRQRRQGRDRDASAEPGLLPPTLKELVERTGARTSAPRWTRATCSGRAWTRSPRSAISARWWSTPPPRTSASTRNAHLRRAGRPVPPALPDENRVRLGGDEWVNEWPKDSAWDFVALGRGHDVDFWTDFIERAARGRPGHGWSTSSTRTSRSAGSRGSRSLPTSCSSSSRSREPLTGSRVVGFPLRAAVRPRRRRAPARRPRSCPS